MGWTQDRLPPDGPGTGRGAGHLDDHRDPAPAWPARSAREREARGLPALRAARGQRSVADGLQGPLRHIDRTLPSVDRARRSLPLLALPGGLRPQTMGKDERFHASLKAEVLRERSFRDIQECQSAFERWRHIYNHMRPHEGIAMATPASRYQQSPRAMPEHLAPIAYAPHDLVCKVQQQGWITFKGRDIKLPKAFAGHPVALRPTDQDGLWEVFFCTQRIAQVDLRHPLTDIQRVNYVS